MTQKNLIFLHIKKISVFVYDVAVFIEREAAVGDQVAVFVYDIAFAIVAIAAPLAALVAAQRAAPAVIAEAADQCGRPCYHGPNHQRYHSHAQQASA